MVLFNLGELFGYYRIYEISKVYLVAKFEAHKSYYIDATSNFYWLCLKVLGNCP